MEEQNRNPLFAIYQRTTIQSIPLCLRTLKNANNQLDFLHRDFIHEIISGTEPTSPMKNIIRHLGRFPFIDSIS